MPHPQKSSLTLHHQDLRFGSIFRLPCHLTHALQPAASVAVSLAEMSDSYIRVEGTKFILHVQTKTAEDGNLALSVGSGAGLGNGSLPANSELYYGSLACQLSTAPLAWRQIQHIYLAHMLESPATARFLAPGLMPQTLPWLCGFPTMSAAGLTKEEFTSLLVLVRIVSLILLERGRAAIHQAAARGYVPVVDPKRFLELQDWSH